MEEQLTRVNGRYEYRRPMASSPPSQSEQTSWIFKTLRNKLHFDNYTKHAGLYKCLLSDHLGLLVGLIDTFENQPTKAQIYKDEFVILRDNLISLIESTLNKNVSTFCLFPGKRNKLKAYRKELTESLHMLRNIHYTHVTAHTPHPVRTGMKYCMSHLGWAHLTYTGVCCLCGSAMVEDEDLT